MRRRRTSISRCFRLHTDCQSSRMRPRPTRVDRPSVVLSCPRRPSSSPASSSKVSGSRETLIATIHGDWGEAQSNYDEFSDGDLTWAHIGQLAWAAQGVTEHAASLRAAPSAGVLFPLEVDVATRGGVFRYQPESHPVLKRRAADVLLSLRTQRMGRAGSRTPRASSS